MPGKAFLVVEFQFSGLPHKMMIKNSVLTTHRQMDLLDFAIKCTVARTLSNLDIRYIAWSALYGTMKNDSVQEPVTDSAMQIPCKRDLRRRM